MNKKSKVTSVQANGTWDGKFGTMYKHEITFENGDCGEYSSKAKDQQKFIIGQEAEYTYTDGQYPKVKPIFVQSGGGNWKPNDNPERQLMIVKQSSLKVASDLCISEGKTDLKIVFAKAKMIVDWVMNEEKKDEKTSEAEAFVKVESTSDMPF
jgi:hypothetical protein|tara:strand:+ start:10044 stop:10502 length:459 start_codon:yes stop_codon:yes gene_type:complete